MLLRRTAISATVSTAVSSGAFTGLAFFACVGLVGLSSPAHAQASEVPMTQRDYAISAGPLGEVLGTFAGSAGVVLSFDAALTAGKSSAGLRGRYSVEQGFAELLRGQALEAVRGEGGVLLLRVKPRASSEPTLLSAVRVVGAQAAPGAVVKIDEAAVTRSGASILDTPQTVNVVAAELAREQNAQTLGDVVRNVAGMRANSYFGANDEVNSRGFGLSNIASYLRDGFRFTNLLAMPRHHIARYEALKGPASMDYGRSEPGGLINIVTQRPQAEPVGEIHLGVGEYDAYDLGFDVGNALNEQKSLLYRLDGALTRQAFASEAVVPEQYGVAGALSYQLSPQTRIDLDAELSRREQLFYPGLPVPEPMDAKSADELPVGAFYGEGAVGDFGGEHRFLGTRVEHRFNSDWSLDAGYARNLTERTGDYVRISGLSDDGLSVVRNAFSSVLKYYNNTAQLQLKGRLMLGGTTHRITTIADHSTWKVEYTLGGGGTIGPISLARPQPTGVQFEPLLPGGAIHNRTVGVSIQDYAELTPWLNLLLGARYSEFSEINTDAPDQKGDSVDPTVGLVFKPREAISLYASLSRSSTPNVGTLVGPGAFADPSDAEQFEVGGKAEWFDGALRTSVALFELTKSNVPTPSDNPLYSVLAGEVRSRGWELEVVGQLTARWSLLLNYARTDAEIRHDNIAANVGKTLSYAPKDSASLWSTYALSAYAPGWSVGGGVFHTGDRFVANDNLVSLPSNTITDLVAIRQFDARLRNARLQLNLRNVFDERYYDAGYAGAQGFTSVIPGLPRSFSLSVVVPLR